MTPINPPPVEHHQIEALPGRYFMRDGEWIKAAPESPIGETLYRRTDGAPANTPEGELP